MTKNPFPEEDNTDSSRFHRDCIGTQNDRKCSTFRARLPLFQKGRQERGVRGWRGGIRWWIEKRYCLKNTIIAKRRSVYISRYWSVVGIFIPINTILLGGSIYTVIGSDSIRDLLLVPFSLAMSFILWQLLRWLARVNYKIQLTYYRMREIENELGMLENLTIHWIDHPEETPKGQEQRVSKIRQLYKPPKSENQAFKAIIYALIVLWGIHVRSLRLI